jgi:nucleoside-diphosphate-sugar epimerase
VTGGSGRIGNRVVRHLWERGHDVINIDRRAPKEATARFCYADIRQRAQLQPLLDGVDAVCHLAEIPTNSAMIPPEEVYIHNTTVGATVLQTAADLKIKRLIYTSTCQVYGIWGVPALAPRQLPMDETHPLQPNNSYACGKVANEHLAQMISRTAGLSIAIFRFPQVTSIDYEGAGNDLAKWFDGRLEFGDGFGTHVHTEDAAHAYVLALENQRPGCEAYHFSAEEALCGIPIREFVQGRHPDGAQLPADWPKYKSFLDCAKAKAHLNWAPQRSLLEYFRGKFGRDPHPAERPAHF